MTDRRPKLFAYAQQPAEGIEAGTPILAALLAYFDSQFLHSFNASLKKTRDQLAAVLGSQAPSTLPELADLAEGLLRFGTESQAVHHDHAVGMW